MHLNFSSLRYAERSWSFDIILRPGSKICSCDWISKKKVHPCIFEYHSTSSEPQRSKASHHILRVKIPWSNGTFFGEAFNVLETRQQIRWVICPSTKHIKMFAGLSTFQYCLLQYMHTLHLFLCQLKMEETRFKFNLRIPPNHFGGFSSKAVSKQKKNNNLHKKGAGSLPM